MNRTAFVWMSGLLATAGILAPGRAQEPAKAPDAKAQDDVMKGVVDSLRAREAAVRRVRLRLTTEGNMPGGLSFTTSGTLRVLRTEQGEVQAVQSSVDYQFVDGLTGHLETVKTPEGLWIYEQNPTQGETYHRMDRALVADIEWAGQILQRDDLPGRVDARATAPLGSELVADLAQRYQLRDLGRRDEGRAGTWYGGPRRPGPGLEGEDPDVPIADHVELFVGERENALLEVVYLQQGEAVQRIRVDELVVDEPMPLETFQLDDKGRRPRDVRDNPPMWQQIQDLLQRAQEKAGGELPPSKR